MAISWKIKIAIAIIGAIFVACLIGGVYKLCWDNLNDKTQNSARDQFKKDNNKTDSKTDIKTDSTSKQPMTEADDAARYQSTTDNIKINSTPKQSMTEPQTTQTYCNFTSVKYNRQQCHDHLSKVIATKVTSRNDLIGNLFTEIPEHKLNLSFTGLSEIKKNTFEDRKNISLIDISSNELTFLQNNSFNLYKETLKILILASNKLARLESDSFNDLLNLKYLDISKNELKSLPDKIFNELKSLNYLYLKSNKLAILDYNIFNSLSNLEYLDIKNVNLNPVFDKIVNKWTSWEGFLLTSNDVASLRPETVKSLLSFAHTNYSTGSIYFYLHNTDMYPTLLKLENLHFNALDKLANLKHLDVSNNYLISLPDKIFIDLKSLNYLNLQSNQLASLDSNIFKSLSNLKYLDISSNRLEYLPDKIFNELYNLTILRLESNKLARFEPNIFMNLWFLEELDISKNQLTFLPIDIFKGTVALKKLDIYMNQGYILRYFKLDDICMNQVLLTVDRQYANESSCTATSRYFSSYQSTNIVI